MLLKALVRGGHGGYYTVADDELTLDLGYLGMDTEMSQAAASLGNGRDTTSAHTWIAIVRPNIMFAEMGNRKRWRYSADTTAGLEDLTKPSASLYARPTRPNCQIRSQSVGLQEALP